MSDTQGSNEDLKYFYSEIAEEGSAFIAFGYLNREYEWSLQKFEYLVREAAREGLCDFELLEMHDDNRDVSIEDVDFSSPEGFRMLQFVPTDIAWEAYNRLL